jgi:hypothetical protein
MSIEIKVTTSPIAALFIHSGTTAKQPSKLLSSLSCVTYLGKAMIPSNKTEWKLKSETTI